MRPIPDDNLGYAVLVSLPNGSAGSGFFLTSGAATFLVTAHHVLFDRETGSLLAPEVTLTAYSPDPLDTEQNVIGLNLDTLHADGQIKADALRDVVVIRLLESLSADSNQVTRHLEGTSVPGVSGLKLAPAGIVAVPLSHVALFDQALIANEVYVFGYPVSLGLQHCDRSTTQGHS